MAKPPKATPHSDIDGVHQDEKSNTDVASDLGQSAASLSGAKKRSAARPEYAADRPNKDDRTS